MGISLYYTARRERELGDDERAQITENQVQENQVLFDRLNELLPKWKKNGTVPSYVTETRQICEGLHFYGTDASTDPGVILEGSSKVSHGQCGLEVMIEQLDHYMQVTLVRLRRALPDAEWEARVDDDSLMWDEENGEYVFASK